MGVTKIANTNADTKTTIKDGPVTLAKMNSKELKAECDSLKLVNAGSDQELRVRLNLATQLSTVASPNATPEDCNKAIAALTATLSRTVSANLNLASSIRDIHLVESLQVVLLTSGKKAAPRREAAAKLVCELLTACGKPILPLMTPLMPALVEISGDKMKGPKVAGQQCVSIFIRLAGEFGPALLLPSLLQRPDQWMANQARIQLVTAMCSEAPEAMARTLSTTLPLIAEELQDVKAKVQVAARECMAALCSLCPNQDVTPLVPTLMSALENADEITECVHSLASTTFVQTVDGPTLSIMCPILVRGFSSRSDQTKRSCARIVENMAKLVEDPAALAENFLPTILPKLEAAKEHVSDPEARKVCGKATEILIKKATLKAGQKLPGSPSEMLAMINAELKLAGITVEESNADVTAYLAVASGICAALLAKGAFDVSVWSEALTVYLDCINTQVSGLIEGLVEKVIASLIPVVEEEEKVEGVELCNCEFSLAYGNKVLLRKTRLRLIKGQNYGLIGQNDSGKTSLMKAIADHRVEGFPDESELRTVFVETDIQGELSDLTVLDYIMADKLLAALNISREDMTVTLNKVGFTADSPANVSTCVGALSGGWKMKLALARAMLLNADILLLDEPTNHLDSYNVKWVEDYLKGLTDVTCVMVSHDSGFLNRICNNIVQIDDFRLKFHHGDLTSFVEKHPEAQSFFELKTAKFAFTFPQPARLKGVNSKGKPIMKMNDISFTYPGATKPQLKNVTIQVSLGSRVACVGVNGAGKSTMIKLLTGELEPDKGSGDVWTHANMTYGYIAQHAFHHIEEHLDVTPNQYIRERYGNGNDREALNKITTQVSDKEKKAMAQPVTFNVKDIETSLITKMKGKIEKLTTGRRELKAKKTQEYEVKLQGGTGSTTYWIERDILLENGWEKVIKQVDDKITIREAMFQNPLTKANVTKHLADVGLDEEFSTHVNIRALSGGQKVKVVLGAALWNRPHVLILDEPTNYLDRDSLGALAAAIRIFEGGVVMITHNSQFCDNLCPQVWHLENNTLNVKGDAEWMNVEKLKDVVKGPQVNVDKFGNEVVIVKGFDDLPRKMQKKLKKAREKTRKAAKKAGMDEEEIEFGDGYDFDAF